MGEYLLEGRFDHDDICDILKATDCDGYLSLNYIDIDLLHREIPWRDPNTNNVNSEDEEAGQILMEITNLHHTDTIAPSQ